MSWLTPFQNLIIRFKIGSGGSSSGGITEELLNSKLAAFYTATETKILNLVNSKLATYVTQTAFNELETKVETNTTNISNLGNNITTNTNNINSLTTRVTALEKNNNNNGTQLSLITGKVYLNNLPTTFTSYQQFGTGPITSITLNNGTILSFKNLNKYIVSCEWGFNSSTFIDATSNNNDLRTQGIFIYPDYYFSKTALNLENKSISFDLVWINTGGAATRTIKWKNTKPYFDITIILSNSLNNIQSAFANSINEITSNNSTIEVVSWRNMG